MANGGGAKAGYRFVPLAEKWCPAPLQFVAPKEEKSLPPDAISHGRPLADGLCGVINVTWEAETPFCLGEQKGERKKDQPAVVTPYKLGDNHAIPGASLKGMLRSVVEILSFSHLGKINADHRFGFRDYRMNEYTSRVSSNDIKAGWLVYDKDRKRDDEKWRLAPARGPRGFHYLEISMIEDMLGGGAWKILELKKKRGKISEKFSGERVYFASVFEKSKSVIDQLSDKPRPGWREGYFAFSWKVHASSNKKYETIIEAPMAEEQWHPLTPERMKEFSFFNSQVVGDRVAPEESWKYWLEVTGWDEPISGEPISKATWSSPLPGIPVFYTGDPAGGQKKGKNAFHMGLSRVIKIGYDQSVGDVAARTLGKPGEPYFVPHLNGDKDGKKEEGQGIDFARALFGDVEGQETDKNEKDRLALKGRVAFEFAWATKAEEERFPHTVFMGPRASFWPFYLRDQKRFNQSVSYNSPLAVLAGRKRYPAREPAAGLAQATGKPEMDTKITFLRKGATFEGQIRFHNLHPVELGALLCALALGDKNAGSTRHSLGHAKSLGYGRLACTYSLTVEPNNKKQPKEAGEYIREFRDHMEGWYAKTAKPPQNWLGSPQVKGLLIMSYPVKHEHMLRSLGSIEKPQDFGPFKKGTTTLADYSSEFDSLEGKPPGLGRFLDPA